MIKQVAALILLLVLVVQTFSKAVITFNFYLHQSYIAQVLCENKDQPKRNCCGKCQLKKKLNEEEKNNKQTNNQKRENSDDIVLTHSFFIIPFLSVSLNKIYTATYAAYPVNRSYTVFRPPCV